MTTSAPQVIRADESYTLPELMRRLGVADHAIKTYRRNGLRVIHPPGSRRPFVLGSDWLEFLRQAAETEGSQK